MEKMRKAAEKEGKLFEQFVEAARQEGHLESQLAMFTSELDFLYNLQALEMKQPLGSPRTVAKRLGDIDRSLSITQRQIKGRTAEIKAAKAATKRALAAYRKAVPKEGPNPQGPREGVLPPKANPHRGQEQQASLSPPPLGPTPPRRAVADQMDNPDMDNTPPINVLFETQGLSHVDSLEPADATITPSQDPYNIAELDVGRAFHEPLRGLPGSRYSPNFHPEHYGGQSSPNNHAWRDNTPYPPSSRGNVQRGAGGGGALSAAGEEVREKARRARGYHQRGTRLG